MSSSPQKQHQKPLDRLPPHSPEAEKGTLGCLLTAPGPCFPELMRLVGKLDPNLFYDLRHQTIFLAVLGMYERNDPIEFLTVNERLRQDGQLEAVGGSAVLVELMEAIPSTANLGYYVAELLNKYRTRKIIQTCVDATSKLFDGESADETLAEIEQKLLLVKDGTENKGFLTGKDIAASTVERLDNEHSGVFEGVFSGLPDLDKTTTGWQPGEMVVIAGRPGTGKTALALQILLHNTVTANVPVGIFSLEMLAVALGVRMVCNLADVDTRASREKRLSERDFARLSHAATQISGSKMIADESADLDIRTIRARARRMVHEYGVKMIIVDYVQLVTGVTRRASENRVAEVAEVSSGIKAMAKELKVPVIALAQLNRESAKREGKPRMEDLKESGQLEQDATFIGLIYRATTDGVEIEKENRTKIIPINLFVAKQRDGESGDDVNLIFHKRTQRITSAAKVSEDDIPK